ISDHPLSTGTPRYLSALPVRARASPCPERREKPDVRRGLSLHRTERLGAQPDGGADFSPSRNALSNCLPGVLQPSTQSGEFDFLGALGCAKAPSVCIARGAARRKSAVAVRIPLGRTKRNLGLEPDVSLAGPPAR